MKKLIAQILAAVLLLSLAACGQTAAQVESSSSQVTAVDGTEAISTSITITDLAGQTHTFDTPVDKVIVQWTGAGGPFFTMAALFGSDFTNHMVNLDTGLQSGNADMWEQFIQDVPALQELPHIGNFHNDTFDMEAAVSSGADAVLIPLGLKDTLANGGFDKQFEKAGIPVIYFDFHAETLENHVASITLMGKLFQKEERAKELVDFYVAHVTPVYARVSELLKTNVRPLVHMEVGFRGPNTAPEGFSNTYSWGKMIYDVGGTCTGEGVIKNQGELQPELLLEMNPDKIIFAGLYAPKNAGSIRLGYGCDENQTRQQVEGYFNTRAGWEELDAYKKGEVYLVPHAIARDLFDCACVEALAKDIWPVEFADLDPAATLGEFFERFLPFTFDGTWFMKY